MVYLWARALEQMNCEEHAGQFTLETATHFARNTAIKAAFVMRNTPVAS